MELVQKGFDVYIKLLAMDDVGAIVENANDPEVARSVSAPGTFPSPYEKSDAIEFVKATIAARKEMRGLHFGIHHVKYGLIGACTLMNIDIRNKTAEIGYWLGKVYWGQGYTKQALRLLEYLAFIELELNRLYAYTYTFNTRSSELLAGLGYSIEGLHKQAELHGDKYVDKYAFALLKSEYADDIKPRITEI
ncbi:MAG: GNAT family N-acetyltransferase [Candidatus Micrarchaeota archaeon]|nr:GNAT family N-acetyltransferase [Candidatus Micrarchaeota archaeon]